MEDLIKQQLTSIGRTKAYMPDRHTYVNETQCTEVQRQR